MNKLISTSLYSLVGGVLLLVIVIISTGLYPSPKNKVVFPNSLTKNFDDCKSRGYMVSTSTTPETCTTPTGTIFIDLHEAMATTSVEIITHKSIHTKVNRIQ